MKPLLSWLSCCGDIDDPKDERNNPNGNGNDPALNEVETKKQLLAEIIAQNLISQLAAFCEQNDRSLGDALKEAFRVSKKAVKVGAKAGIKFGAPIGSIAGGVTGAGVGVAAAVGTEGIGVTMIPAFIGVGSAVGGASGFALFFGARASASLAGSLRQRYKLAKEMDAAENQLLEIVDYITENLDQLINALFAEPKLDVLLQGLLESGEIEAVAAISDLYLNLLLDNMLNGVEFDLNDLIDQLAKLEPVKQLFEQQQRLWDDAPRLAI